MPCCRCSTRRPAAANASSSSDSLARPRVGSVAASRVVLAAQHADDGGELLQHGVGGAPDVDERGPTAPGWLCKHMGGGTGLHVDHRDVVGDHVVQLAGDAQPLLGDPAAGLLLAGLLGTAGALLDLCT